MKKQDRAAGPAFGGSSLLVIFAVLCLIVFAMLSLSTVQAEKRLSDAMADGVAAYYRADLQAEEIFARLRSGEDVPDVICDGGVYRYACEIAENQALIVEVRQSADGWEGLRWQSVSQMEEADGDLPVWDGK